MDKLAVLSDIERRLATIETVDEAKAIRDQAEAIRVYAKSARKGLAIQNRAASIKILAEQRAGALLAKVERSGGGRGKTPSRLAQVYEEIGGETTGKRYQIMSRLPVADTRRLEAECNEAHAELTSAEVYRLAKGGGHVRHNTGESEWYTPAKIIQAARDVLGGIDLDPATHEDAQAIIQAGAYFTTEMDGLAHEWAGRVWLNPPYSQPAICAFCDKLLAEMDAGRVTAAITLTNNATETDWGQALLRRADALCFPRGRVHFWAPRRESAPLQGQMLCAFGVQTEAFAEAFAWLGVVLQ